MDGPDWEDVRVFLAVAEAGSLAAAARTLRLGETTVGRRLRALEEAVGGRLVDRLPNRLALTPLGRDLARAAQPMRAGADALARRAQARSGAGRPAVRVTATASVALFLATHAAELTAACPGAEVAVAGSRRPASLARREAEIALRMRRVPEEGDLAARRLGRFAFAVYAARACCDRAGWRGDAGDARRLDLVGLPAESREPSQSRWLDAFAGVANGEGSEEGGCGRVRLRLGDVALRHRAAADGLGMTLLPCFLGDADGRLLRIAPPPPELAEDVHLLVHEDLRGAPAIRAVIDALALLFRRHAEALSGGAG